MPETGKNALLVLLSVAVGLIIAEIAIRLAGIAPPEVRCYDALRGWRLRPGAIGLQRSEGQADVMINSGGFRGPEVSIAKPDGVVRIAVLGDSFAEAMQVPYSECFSAVAEYELAACTLLAARRVQVLDFGVSGYGTGQELLTLREQVWRYSPDVVVLAFFSGNDVSDNSATLDTESWLNGEKCRPHFAIHDDAAAVELDDFREDPLHNLWCQTVFAFNRFTIMDYLGQPFVAIHAALGLDHGLAARVAGSEPGLDDEIYGPPQTPQWQQAWTVTERLITEMSREVKARGALFLLVTLSTPVQVYPDPAYRASYLKAVGASDLFYPEHRLDVLGARDGFAVLNLAPVLQAYADRSRAFVHGFPNTRKGTGHWNALGHRLSGELIAQRVCGLLKEAPKSAAR